MEPQKFFDSLRAFVNLFRPQKKVWVREIVPSLEIEGQPKKKEMPPKIELKDETLPKEQGTTNSPVG